MAKSLLYVAIDFGTAYSGYSVKFNDVSESAKHFRAIVWGQEFGISTCKTPTCILFDKHKRFVDFGYAALAKCHRDGLENGYFFENFKTELYGTEDIQMNFKISAVNGAKMKAINVISESLRFLKDHALEKINNFDTSATIVASDITWVLTVPAIWDDAAKEFMREAAKLAGLVTESDPARLVMALEPEAAAVYCQRLPCNLLCENSGTERLDATPGTQFITLDCGGGTIDITVHEVVGSGFLKQLDQASGNNLGGQNIDAELKAFLQNICGPECWEEYVKNHAEELLHIMGKFDSAKCADKNKGFTFSCPYNLQEIVKKCKKLEVKNLLEGVDGVKWKNGYVVITAEKMKSFFDQSLRATAKLLNDIMGKPGLHIEYMLLVGGYAMCKALQTCLKDQFGSRCTVLCPQHPQEAVMVGAAEFGSQPDVVKSRIAPLTYGIEVGMKFDETKHKPEKKFTSSDGEIYCQDLFHRLVKRGESVGFEETRDFIFHPIGSKDTSMTFRFFNTTKDNAEYVDDCGMNEVDSFSIAMPDTTGGKDREMSFKVRFGFTEITATAHDLTSGNTKIIKIRFLK